MPRKTGMAVPVNSAVGYAAAYFAITFKLIGSVTTPPKPELAARTFRV
jgi:hypothetical protein